MKQIDDVTLETCREALTEAAWIHRETMRVYEGRENSRHYKDASQTLDRYRAALAALSAQTEEGEA